MGERRKNDGRVKDVSSTDAQQAADQWHRLDEEEKQARRARKAQRASHTRRKPKVQSGPVTSLRVHPAVMKAALKAAGGDASRLRIVSETEVWVE